MAAIVYTERAQLSVVLRHGGCYERLVWNEMSDEAALRLLPQYGRRADEVAALVERYCSAHPYCPDTQQTLLQAVRQLEPGAVRVRWV